MKYFNFTKACLCLVFIIMAIMLCGFIFEQNPVSYKNNPFELTGQVYKQSDVISYKVERCTSKDVYVTSSQFLVRLDATGTSPTRYPLLSGAKNLKKGCEVVDSTPKEIPNFAEEGVYDIESTIIIRGTFKNFISVVSTIPFQIITATSTATTTKIIKVYVPSKEVIGTTTVTTVINTYQTSTPQVFTQNTSQPQHPTQQPNQSTNVTPVVSPAITLPVLPINIHL